MLAPSAFLASAASTHDLQQSIFPESIGSLDDESVSEVCWKSVDNDDDVPVPRRIYLLMRI